MNKNKIYKASLENVANAVDILKSGKIIVYPTDTLYGFGVDASNEQAINELNRLKNRVQPLSILLSNKNQIDDYAIIDNDKNINNVEVINELQQQFDEFSKNISNNKN